MSEQLGTCRSEVPPHKQCSDPAWRPVPAPAEPAGEPQECPKCSAKNEAEASQRCSPIEGDCPIVEGGFRLGWPTVAQWEDAMRADAIRELVACGPTQDMPTDDDIKPIPAPSGAYECPACGELSVCDHGGWEYNPDAKLAAIRAVAAPGELKPCPHCGAVGKIVEDCPTYHAHHVCPNDHITHTRPDLYCQKCGAARVNDACPKCELQQRGWTLDDLCEQVNASRVAPPTPSSTPAELSAANRQVAAAENIINIACEHLPYIPEFTNALISYDKKYGINRGATPHLRIREGEEMSEILREIIKSLLIVAAIIFYGAPANY